MGSLYSLFFWIYCLPLTSRVAWQVLGEAEKVIQVVDVVQMTHTDDPTVTYPPPSATPTPAQPRPQSQPNTYNNVQKTVRPSDRLAHLPDEQRLLNYVMRGYEKSVRPVRIATTPVVIRMGLTLTQIFDMDEKDQVLVTNVWLDQEWVDEFMVWDPADFNNITMLRIPCHKLWLPDIVLYNNAAEYTDGLMPANAMIEFTGNVFWPVPTKLQSSCKVDVTYFPFDYQTCRLKFGSWTYDGYQVDITNRTREVDLSNYVVNGEWELLSIKIVRNVVRYACCEEPFPDVTFYVKIRRRTLYYMYNVVFPCVMMSALTLLVFCLPPDSGEKIALGITVLLAFSVFMLAVAENLPETSEFVPLISIYLTIVMSLTSVSVIMTVFVLNLHHRGPDKRAIPPWLRRLFLGTLRSRGSLFNHRDGYGGYGHGYGSSGADGSSHLMRNLSLKVTLESLARDLRDELHLENGGLLMERFDLQSASSAPVQTPPHSPAPVPPPPPHAPGYAHAPPPPPPPSSSSSSSSASAAAAAAAAPGNVTITRRAVDFAHQLHPNPPPQQHQHQQQQQQQCQHQQTPLPPPPPPPPPTSATTTTTTTQPPPQAFPTPESLASHLLQHGLAAGAGPGAGVGGGGGGVGGAGKPHPHAQPHLGAAPGGGSGRRRNGYSYEEVLLSLLRILERHEREEKEYESVQDWRRLAQTVDRILFFFFLFLTVASTLAVLVIAPSLQE